MRGNHQITLPLELVPHFPRVDPKLTDRNETHDFVLRIAYRNAQAEVKRSGGYGKDVPLDFRGQPQEAHALGNLGTTVSRSIRLGYAHGYECSKLI